MTRRSGVGFGLGEHIGTGSSGARHEGSHHRVRDQDRTSFVPLCFWFGRCFLESDSAVPLILTDIYETKKTVTF